MNIKGMWDRERKLRTDRWTHWAKSLSGRYGRIAARRQGPAMTLIQPGRSEERWIHASWTINPQIHLWVHPVLRGTTGSVWGSFQSVLTKPANLAYVPGPRFSTANVALEQEAAGVVRHKTGHHTREVPQGHGRSLMKSAASYSWIQTQNTQQILPRLLQERKRIEQSSFYRPAAMRHMAPVVASAEPNEQARRRPGTRIGQAPSLATNEVFESLQAWRMNAPGMSRSKMPPEVDLERLTEQVVRKIDERIVAHRERLGKNF